VKNLLVFAAPGTAGVLTDPGTVAVAAGTFAAFCLVAGGTYFLNDALNVDADRLHPRKCRRPIARGVVGVGLAEALAASLLTAAVAFSLVLTGWRLALAVGATSCFNPSTACGIRNVPVIDLVVVASDFVLRAIAGGVAVGVPTSRWFLIVTSFGSLFLVSGKRNAEHIDLGINGLATGPPSATPPSAPGTVIDVTGLASVYSFDGDRGMIRVSAGTSLGALTRLLLPLG
jgi:decaprenyl-phosphate phosphoribosyltransferase